MGNSKTQRKKAIKLSFTAPLHSPLCMHCNLIIVQVKCATSQLCKLTKKNCKRNCATGTEWLTKEKSIHSIMCKPLCKKITVQKPPCNAQLCVCDKRLCNCETFQPRNCARKKHLCNAQLCSTRAFPSSQLPSLLPLLPSSPQPSPHPPHNHLLQCKQWGLVWGEIGDH